MIFCFLIDCLFNKTLLSARSLLVPNELSNITRFESNKRQSHPLVIRCVDSSVIKSQRSKVEFSISFKV